MGLGGPGDEGGEAGLQLWVWKTQFIIVLLFINYYIIFHINNRKPTFVPPCTLNYHVHTLSNNFLFVNYTSINLLEESFPVLKIKPELDSTDFMILPELVQPLNSLHTTYILFNLFKFKIKKSLPVSLHYLI